MDTDSTGQPVPIIVTHTVTVNLKGMGIGLAIVGGDRIIADWDDLRLEALAWDPLDLSSSPGKQDPSIKLSWSCTTLAEEPCTDK